MFGFCFWKMMSLIEMGLTELGSHFDDSFGLGGVTVIAGGGVSALYSVPHSIQL